VPVDRVVTTYKEVQKVVEKPIVYQKIKTVENRVDRIVYRTKIQMVSVDKIVRQPVTKIVEVEKVVQKPVRMIQVV